jgi:hypothetical protein
MVTWGKDGVLTTHHVGRRRAARDEVVVVFGLTEIVEALPAYPRSHWLQARIDELNVKAMEVGSQSPVSG